MQTYVNTNEWLCLPNLSWWHPNFDGQCHPWRSTKPTGLNLEQRNNSLCLSKSKVSALNTQFTYMFSCCFILSFLLCRQAWNHVLLSFSKLFRIICKIYLQPFILKNPLRVIHIIACHVFFIVWDYQIPNQINLLI